MASPSIVMNRVREHRFYTTLALLAALLVFVGFARTYFLKQFFESPELPALVHLHGLLFSSWIVLFVTQTTLVAAKRTDIHRKLGVLGLILALAMIVVGPLTAIEAAKHGPAAPSAAPPDIPPLVFLIIPLGDIAIFAPLVGLALYFRRKPEIHKRLMLLTAIVLLPPAVARIPALFHITTNPLVFFGIPDLILLGCIAYDYATTKKLSPVFLWGGLAILSWGPARLMLGPTHAWVSFAEWLVK